MRFLGLLGDFPASGAAFRAGRWARWLRQVDAGPGAGRRVAAGPSPRDAVKAAIAVTGETWARWQAGSRCRPQSDGRRVRSNCLCCNVRDGRVVAGRWVSIVIDQAWRSERSEPQLHLLIGRGRAVQVHLSTSPELAGHRACRRGDRGALVGIDEVDDAGGRNGSPSARATSEFRRCSLPPPMGTRRRFPTSSTWDLGRDRGRRPTRNTG